MNRPITSTEIETVIKKFPTNKSPGPDGITGKFHQTFREEVTPKLLKLFQNISEEFHGGGRPKRMEVSPPGRIKIQDPKKTWLQKKLLKMLMEGP